MIIDFLNNATTRLPRLDILQNKEIYLSTPQMEPMCPVDQVYCGFTEPEAAYFYQPFVRLPTSPINEDFSPEYGALSPSRYQPEKEAEDIISRARKTQRVFEVSIDQERYQRRDQRAQGGQDESHNNSVKKLTSSQPAGFKSSRNYQTKTNISREQRGIAKSVLDRFNPKEE